MRTRNNYTDLPNKNAPTCKAHCFFRAFIHSGFVLLTFSLLVGCENAMKARLRNADPKSAAKLIENNLGFLSKHLRLGMPKAEVLTFLPHPHNTNVENVCVWILGYAEQKQAQERSDWQWLQRT